MALRVEEVARQLDVTPHMVYREIKAGRLKAFRVGSRTIRILPEEVEKYKSRQMIDVKSMEVL